MMSKMNQTPHSLANSSLVLRLAIVLLLAAAAAAAQSRIVKPPQPNTNRNTGKRQHIATVRSSDSPEGSRVAISSDQSLNDYEAYRRGDRFYVKIPAADVPRAEAVRGRGFVDVKAQKSGDSTILSFRLQPGATAHVEQRANKLDVVVSVPGGGTAPVATNRTRETMPNVTSGVRGGEPGKRTGATSNSNNAAARTSSNSSAPAKSSALNNSTKAANNSASASRPNSIVKPSPTPMATPTARPSPTAKPSATVKPTATPLKSLTASSSPTATPANFGAQTQGDWWSRMKERGHYWLLFAQLNPLPVAIFAALLLLIIGLLLFQRRRARATRRVRPTKTKSRKPTVLEAATTASAASATATTAPREPAAERSVPIQEKVGETPVVVPAPVVAPIALAPDDGRKERVSRTADEAKKLFAGEAFDAGVIGSDDRETRRLVCAELSSALVGRHAERRERARQAFMQYGYFDDATRDLRIAESENERAAAARRLSFVQDREATPHLIGALGDSSPDVRRAAVEALMDLRDPAAIGPLNSLLQTETDRKVPRNLISQAIDACATATPELSAPAASDSTPAVPDFVPSVPQPVPPSFETEREVIEL
jgi:hypothetical protein